MPTGAGGEHQQALERERSDLCTGKQFEVSVACDALLLRATVVSGGPWQVTERPCLQTMVLGTEPTDPLVSSWLTDLGLAGLHPGGRAARALEHECVRVVAGTDNGADAVGLIVAEQPDLVLVEDRLTMLPGLDVIREVSCLSPQTLVTARVAYGDRVGPLRDAGATTVFARRVPPDEGWRCAC